MILEISTVALFVGLVMAGVGHIKYSNECSATGIIIMALSVMVGYGILGTQVPIKDTSEIVDINTNMIARGNYSVCVKVDDKFLTSEKAEVVMAKPEQLKIRKSYRWNSYNQKIDAWTIEEIVVVPSPTE